MGVLHRMGAVALIAIFIVHLVDVRKQKRAAGRRWKEYIFSPRLADVQQERRPRVRGLDQVVLR